jgi:hypothetical protein
MASKLVRVDGNARVARHVLGALYIVIDAILVVAYCFGGLGFGGSNLELGFLVIDVFCLYMTCRAQMVGVFERDGGIVARDWFRTRSWPKAGLAGCDVDAYSGALNSGNLDGTGRFFKVLTLTPSVWDARGRRREVRINATVGWRTSVLRQAAAVNRILGAED